MPTSCRRMFALKRSSTPQSRHSRRDAAVDRQNQNMELPITLPADHPLQLGNFTSAHLGIFESALTIAFCLVGISLLVGVAEWVVVGAFCVLGYQSLGGYRRATGCHIRPLISSTFRLGFIPRTGCRLTAGSTTSSSMLRWPLWSWVSGSSGFWSKVSLRRPMVPRPRLSLQPQLRHLVLGMSPCNTIGSRPPVLSTAARNSAYIWSLDNWTGGTGPGQAAPALRQATIVD
jgi:hypothetical protein